jgi:hypothetical protein
MQFTSGLPACNLDLVVSCAMLHNDATQKRAARNCVAEQIFVFGKA